jgi:hypothetical protein
MGVYGVVERWCPPEFLEWLQWGWCHHEPVEGLQRRKRDDYVAGCSTTIELLLPRSVQGSCLDLQDKEGY